MRPAQSNTAKLPSWAWSLSCHMVMDSAATCCAPWAQLSGLTENGWNPADNMPLSMQVISMKRINRILSLCCPCVVPGKSHVIAIDLPSPCAWPSSLTENGWNPVDNMSPYNILNVVLVLSQESYVIAIIKKICLVSWQHKVITRTTFNILSL